MVIHCLAFLSSIPLYSKTKLQGQSYNDLALFSSFLLSLQRATRHRTEHVLALDLLRLVLNFSPHHWHRHICCHNSGWWIRMCSNAVTRARFSIRLSTVLPLIWWTIQPVGIGPWW